MVDTKKISSEYEIITDDATIAKAIKGTTKFREGIKDTDETVSRLDDSLINLSDQAQEAGRQIADSMEEAREETSLLSIEAKEAARQFKLMEEQQRNLPPPTPGLGAGIGGVARGAASLQRIPGIAGTPVGAGLGIATDIARLKDALPELGTGIKGIAKSAVSALSSLGPAGIAIGIALAAVAVATKLAADSIAEDVKDLENLLDAKGEVNRLIVQGDEDAVAERKRLAQENIEVAERDLADAREARDKSDAAAFQVSDFLDIIVETEEDAAKKRIETAKDTVASEQAVLDELNAEFPDIEAAARDTGEAIRDIATSARERISLEQEANTLTVEGAEARLKAIDNTRQALEAELVVLENSGDTSKETQDRIEALRKELNRLGEESEIVGSQLSSGAAAAREAAEEHIAALEKVTQARVKASEAIDQAGIRFTEAMQNISEATAQATADAERETKERSKELSESFRESIEKGLVKSTEAINKLIIDIGDKEIKVKEKNLRALVDIEKQASRNIKKALDQRNVLALLQIIESRDQEREDKQKEIERGDKERKEEADKRIKEEMANQKQIRIDKIKAFQKQREDLLDNLDKRLADIDRAEGRRISQAEKARDRSIAMAQKALEKELRLFEEFFRKLDKATRRSLKSKGSDRRLKIGGAGIGGRRRGRSSSFAASTITR